MIMELCLKLRRLRLESIVPAILASLVICGPARAEEDNRPSHAPLGPVPLHLRVHGLPLDQKCQAIVGLEWATSLPVPIRGKSQGYRVYFYPVTTPQTIPEAWSPMATAVLPLNGLEATSCELIKGKSKKMGLVASAQANKLSMQEYDDRYNALSDLTEDLGKAYFKKLEGQKTKTLAAKFLDEFELLSEPGLRGVYVEANPDYWKWIEKLAGRKLNP